MIGAAKRKSTKRKSASKRKSVKRKSVKRKSVKRKSSQRKRSVEAAKITKVENGYKVKNFYIGSKLASSKEWMTVSSRLIYISRSNGRTYWNLGNAKPQITVNVKKLTMKISNKYKIVFKSLQLLEKFSKLLKHKL